MQPSDFLYLPRSVVFCRARRIALCQNLGRASPLRAKAIGQACLI